MIIFHHDGYLAVVDEVEKGFMMVRMVCKGCVECFIIAVSPGFGLSWIG